MAKLKADWLEEAQEMGLEVTKSNTVKEIKTAIKEAKEKQLEEIDEDDEKQSTSTAAPIPEGEEAEEIKEKLAEEIAEIRGDEDTEEPQKKPQPEQKPKKAKHQQGSPYYERASKRYKEAYDKVDKSNNYSIDEAIKLAIETSTVNFDASVELHFNLNVDPRQADQMVRGTVTLPNGTGKTKKIAVIAPKDLHAEIKKAGADEIGDEQMVEKIKKGDYDFDMLIAHPAMMSEIGKLGQTLGPQGLMPNPKSGTVTDNPVETVKQMKEGRIEFRFDKYGIIHQSIGKVSFGEKKIKENFMSFLRAIKEAKPRDAKFPYIKNATLTTSMGPSISLNIHEIN